MMLRLGSGGSVTELSVTDGGPRRGAVMETSIELPLILEKLIFRRLDQGNAVQLCFELIRNAKSGG